MIGVHPEIEIARRKVLQLFLETRRYLEAKPAAFLEDLQHRAEEARFDENFTTRTAAEINRAACVLILAERAGELTAETQRRGGGR